MAFAVAGVGGALVPVDRLGIVALDAQAHWRRVRRASSSPSDRPFPARAWSQDRTRSCIGRADRRRRRSRHWDRRARAQASRSPPAWPELLPVSAPQPAPRASWRPRVVWLWALRRVCRPAGVCGAGRRQRDLRRRACRQHQAACHQDRYRTQDFHSGAYPCSALTFPDHAAWACLIACSTSASAAAAPRGSAQMKSPTRTKSAPAAANSRGLLARGGKADARRLEQFGPPLQPLGDRLDRGPLPVGVGLAEQHVIGAGFARGHRIVPRRQAADAGDAIGFQARQRLLHGLDAGQMRAIGAARGRPVRHDRRATAPRRWPGPRAPAP